MKYILSILLFTICTEVVYLQSRFIKIDSILDSRVYKDYEKIATYRYGYQSYHIISQGYIFWKKDESSYIQKLEFSGYPNEKLYVYELLKIPKNNIVFKYFNVEKNLLQNEALIKPYAYENSGWNNGILNTGKPYNVHGSYSRIKIFYDESTYDRIINHFDLKENHSTSTADKNVHFEHNNVLKITELDRAIFEYVNKLKEQNLFKLKNK